VLETPGLQGFSLEPAPGECTSGGLESVTVVAAPLPEGEGRALACRGRDLSSVRRPGLRAPEEEPDSDWAEQLGRRVCLDAETLAFIGEDDCPRIVVMPLAGCRANLVCQEPDWDLRQDPPAWWPCAAQ
jgi:hypothetical protein